MKLTKIKQSRTFVTSIKYTPKEFLDLLRDMGLELETKLPGLLNEEDSEIIINVDQDEVVWDDDGVVVTFKPSEYDVEGDYESYCPEVK